MPYENYINVAFNYVLVVLFCNQGPEILLVKNFCTHTICVSFEYENL